MSDSLNYKDTYEQSINQPDVFWGKAAKAIQWTKKWSIRFSTKAISLFTA